ncbi:hypothetical protein RCOM_1409710 [Ricinus communis]|uniref:Uncharacterized protein n=1 Tax=Ricinus communis TaxID=3988 RepID=B9SC86_RICCO|nr:hypothetical protein RCOM_1409710 [Ricinus communis]
MLEKRYLAATPHAAAAAAFVTKIHPDWGPATIRNGILFHIDPYMSLNSGCIYDATADDYIKLLRAMNYKKKQMQIITRPNHNYVNKSLDLNYPSSFAYFTANYSDKGKIMHEF